MVPRGEEANERIHVCEQVALGHCVRAEQSKTEEVIKQTIYLAPESTNKSGRFHRGAANNWLWINHSHI